MHWQWKNCSLAWQGKFQDKDKNQRIILEAILDQLLHIWHAFFGLSGGNNNINVLERSFFVGNILHGKRSNMQLEVNGHQ
jgi:hypothetical protein